MWGKGGIIVVAGGSTQNSRFLISGGKSMCNISDVWMLKMNMVFIEHSYLQYICFIYSYIGFIPVFMHENNEINKM